MSFHDFIARIFLALHNIPLSGCTTVLFIHSPTEEYLVCFQVLTIMNKGATNSHVWVFVQFSTTLGKY